MVFHLDSVSNQSKVKPKSHPDFTGFKSRSVGHFFAHVQHGHSGHHSQLENFLSSPSPPSSRLNPLHHTYRLHTLSSGRTTHVLKLRIVCLLKITSQGAVTLESLMGGDERHQQHQTEPQSELTASERAEALWLHAVAGGKVWTVFLPFLLLQDGGWGGAGPRGILTQAPLWWRGSRR